MPGILHEKIVAASKRATPVVLSIGADITKVMHRSQPRRTPDLFSGNEIAVEALTFPNGGRLEKFGYAYKSLVVAISIPANVTDVWLYDETIDAIVEKFHRDISKVKAPRVPLECFRCDYVWVPRISRMPKMCPRCKRRDWNIRPKKGYDERQRKQDRIRALAEKS